MKTRTVRFLWTLVLSLMLAGGSGLSAAAQDSATPESGDGDPTDMVGTYRAQTRLQESIFGPERGALAHDPEVITYAPAGINVQNFFAKIRVNAPFDGQEQLWDAGFTFRTGRDADWRVVVYSDGTWDFRIGSGDPITSGEIPEINIAEGDTNDLELAVDGDTGYLAVNGDQVGSFDVSRRNVAGDVAFGVTFVESALKAGAETPYSRFQVWQLEDSEPAGVKSAARSLLEKGRDIADTADPLEGPSSGDLDETAGSVTTSRLGVEVADFYARVEVTNPRDHEVHPFDYGFGVRDAGGDEQYRIIFASDGSWYLKFGVEPVLAAENFEGLETGAGDTNLLEVVASGDELVFAVNGDIAGSADISELSEPGDIAIAVGFYPAEDIVEGATTSFSDFTAWSLSDESTTPTEEVETPEPTEEVETPDPTEEVETPESIDPEDTANSYLDRTDSLEIVYGPESGDLVHQTDSITYVDTLLDLENFIVHVEFINPYAATEGSWDFGVLFRLGDDEPHLRLIVTSTGDWYLTPGTGDPLQEGAVEDLELRGNRSNSLDLIVDGETGYLIVNDQFIDVLDLSDVTQSGDLGIATAFFEGNFQEGATTSYEDFVVWSLDEGTSTPEPTEEASATAEIEETPEAGDTYESPGFGYTVGYDEPWTISLEESDETGDHVRFSDEVSTIDIWGFESDFTPAECLEDELNYYQTARGYSDAEVAIDVNDNEMTGEIDDFVWGVYWFTYTAEGGDPIDYTSYVECRPIEEGVSILRIVQFVEFDSYNDEIDERVALIEGLRLGGEAPPDETVTAEAETPTTDETAEAGGDSTIVQIEALNGDEISGLATIEESGARSTVRVLAVGAEDGTVVVIQAGSCDDLSGEPEALLESLDGGLSETTVRISFAEVTSGDYVISFHDDMSDLTEALACGEI